MSIRLITQSIWKNPGNRGQRMRRTAYALGWQAWKRVVRQPIQLKLPNSRSFIAHPDCVVSSSLIYARLPEYYELSFVRQVISKRDAIIDAGANVGHIGLLLSDIISPERIFAFEPTPVTFERLQENWSVNKFPLAGLRQVALGDREGDVQFPDLSHPGTMNSQVLDGETSSNAVSVSLRTLDSFRRQWSNTPIGLLKIDVEGHEAEVFRGAIQILREDRPALIMFESLDQAIDPSVAEELAAANYRLFQLDPTGKPVIDATSNQNVFAAPLERFDEIVNP